MRWLVGSIDDWYLLFKRAYACLKPGGWLESYEMSTVWESDDGSVGENTALAQWGKFYVEGGRQSGRTFTVVYDDLQRKAMEAAGFVEIGERDIKVTVLCLGTGVTMWLTGACSNRSGAGPKTSG